MKNEIDVSNIDVKIMNMKWGIPKSEFSHIDKNKITFNGAERYTEDKTICENKKLCGKDI